MKNTAVATGADRESVAKALFLGRILEEELTPFPQIGSEESETLKLVLDSIDKFMSGNDQLYREQDAAGKLTPEYLKQLRELGLFGLIIPEAFGGIGLSNSGYSRALQQTSRYDASTSITIGAHSSIGLKGLLLFGNDEQKQRYLPKLADGRMIAAFCLTEPGSGSDAGSIKTSAAKNPDGSWTLSGTKIWISNGDFAEFFTVFARTDTEHGKLTAFIVERSFGGVSTGHKEDKLGIRASATTTVTFENVAIPAANVLGEEGKGFKVAMSILNNGRTGLGGGCIGGMKRIQELAAKYAAERKQFGKAIAEYGMVKEKLGQMAVDCFATESVVSMVGRMIDSGVEDCSVEAAISKIYATESMWRAANEGLQIAGGNGYMKDYPYERFLRDSRINLIFEGTNEILRLYVAMSGMKEAGEYLKDIAKQLGNVFNEPIKGFGVLSGYVTRKLAQYTPVGRDRLESVAGELREQGRVFEEATAEFAKAVEVVLRRFGKDVVNQQLTMKRIADVAIDLFVGLCVLSRVSSMIKERGGAKCEHEIAIATIFSQQAKRRIAENFETLSRNEDRLIESLADLSVARQGYGWDTI